MSDSCFLQRATSRAGQSSGNPKPAGWISAGQRRPARHGRGADSAEPDTRLTVARFRRVDDQRGAVRRKKPAPTELGGAGDGTNAARPGHLYVIEH